MRVGCGGVLAALSAATLGSAYAAMGEPNWLEVTQPTVPLPGLPASLDGLTIAQLSDLHVTPQDGVDLVRRAVEAVNRSRADLIVLTGDYVTHSADYTSLCVAPLRLLQAPLGIYGVLGNHDIWTDADRVAAGLREAGVTVLRDETVSLRVGEGRLWLVGIDDTGHTSGPGDRCDASERLWCDACSRGAEMLDALPAAEPRLLLVHNPDVHETLPAQRVDLALSGHTHGGQVRLPFFGAPLLPSCYGRKYAQGLVQAPHWPVYVNRGLGTISPKVRFNCRPEVTLLTLRSR